MAMVLKQAKPLPPMAERKVVYFCPRCRMDYNRKVVIWRGAPFCPEHPGQQVEGRRA